MDPNAIIPEEQRTIRWPYVCAAQQMDIYRMLQDSLLDGRILCQKEVGSALD